MMANPRFGFWLLIISAVGLLPIALSYGISPKAWIPGLFEFSADSVNAQHIFRAVMGLYLGMIAIWLLGAINLKYRMSALIALATFMLGLALGRALSFFADGVPVPLLILYFLLEFSIGTLAFLHIRRGFPD